MIKVENKNITNCVNIYMKLPTEIKKVITIVIAKRYKYILPDKLVYKVTFDKWKTGDLLLNTSDLSYLLDFNANISDYIYNLLMYDLSSIYVVYNTSTLVKIINNLDKNITKKEISKFLDIPYSSLSKLCIYTDMYKPVLNILRDIFGNEFFERMYTNEELLDIANLIIDIIKNKNKDKNEFIRVKNKDIKNEDKKEEQKEIEITKQEKQKEVTKKLNIPKAQIKIGYETTIFGKYIYGISKQEFTDKVTDEYKKHIELLIKQSENKSDDIINIILENNAEAENKPNLNITKNEKYNKMFNRLTDEHKTEVIDLLKEYFWLDLA